MFRCMKMYSKMGPAYEPKNEVLNITYADQRSRQKRRVKPSRKILELQDIGQVEPNDCYGNAFARGSDEKGKIVRKNKNEKIVGSKLRLQMVWN